MHLFVALPSHSGTVVAETALTMVSAQQIACERGGTATFELFYGAIISDIRNAMVAAFLGSGADLLLMLDSDQSIERADLERLIDLNEPVVGCLYPKRRFSWGNVKLHPAGDVQQMLYQAMEFAGALEFDDGGQAQVLRGFARALRVGTGILLIRRQAFEIMAERYPELRDCGFDNSEYSGLDEHNWGFFNHIVAGNQPAFSEDTSFCMRWRDAGGVIWADVSSNTSHTGRYEFRGNYLDHLRAKGELTE